MEINTAFRVARPTDRLEEVVRFYRDGLGLIELGMFQDHEGFDGVMLGIYPCDVSPGIHPQDGP